MKSSLKISISFSVGMYKKAAINKIKNNFEYFPSDTILHIIPDITLNAQKTIINKAIGK